MMSFTPTGITGQEMSEFFYQNTIVESTVMLCYPSACLLKRFLALTQALAMNFITQVAIAKNDYDKAISH